MKPLKIQEKLLLLRLKKKDPEAFSEVYNFYVTPVYRFIYFKVSSKQDAEDITSEVFLKIWQFVTESEDEIENLRALIYRVARNLVIDLYRRKATRTFTQENDVLEAVPDERQQRLLEQAESSVEMKSIEHVLRQMKDEYRELIILRYIEDLSINEIAEVMKLARELANEQ